MRKKKDYNTRKQVSCIDCLKKWSKRSDSLKTWKGRCRSCAQKLELNKETRKEISRKAAMKSLAKLGGHIPNGHRFTSEEVRGANNNNWKGGITTENKRIRQSPEYKDWRTAVFNRDDYTCQMCFSRGYELHADHIKPFAFFPELRLVIENGRTLCAPCHRTTVSFGGRGRKNITIPT